MSNFRALKQAKQKQITYQYTNEQIQQMIVDATKNGTQKAFEILLGLTCLVLHNSFGFGEKRCTAVCDRILMMFKRMDCPGGLTLKDVNKAALELGNIKTIL